MSLLHGTDLLHKKRTQAEPIAPSAEGVAVAVESLDHRVVLDQDVLPVVPGHPFRVGKLALVTLRTLPRGP